MPKITVSELTAIYSSKKSDDVVALDGLNAEFISDAFNVIVGYSGCGKTTLLKCIAGLIDYDGEIDFDDNAEGDNTFRLVYNGGAAMTFYINGQEAYLTNGFNNCICLRYGMDGDDEFGKSAIESFIADGIDISNVKTVKNTPTGTAVIIIENGDNRIILDKGANAHLTKEDIDKALENARAGDIYLTQLENPIDVIGYGLKKAKEKGLYVVLNPAPANKDIMPYVGYCDLITPNESETELLGGKDFLLSKCNTLLVTLGGDGFMICDKNGETHYDCIKIKPVDTTAAGDTLCGGLVAMLSKGNDLVASAKFGSKAATIACTRAGAQPSIPTLSEVENYGK